MNITSLKYLVFSLAVLSVYAITPKKYKWVSLLVSSCFFYYSFGAPYLLFSLSVVTIGTYFFGLYIYKAVKQSHKKVFFFLGVLGNIIILILLKYTPFIDENIKRFTEAANIQTDFQIGFHLVAIGVSYFVFQSIAYLADIYLETLKPEKHLGYLALSLSFFPKLIQGPIERGNSILPQIKNLDNINRTNLAIGTHLFFWGLFKKVVVADRLSAFVDPVYSDVSTHYGLEFFIATYLFAFQLYFDFSGYTDMARGVARCFNIKLTENFNSPYLATSTADFWRRWHISFSSWILDYLFKPIQFNLRYWLKWGTPIALIITFFVSGIWHGAAWTYVFWGLLHGIFLGTGVVFKKQVKQIYKKIGFKKGKLPDFLSVFITFHLICFAWVFFRAQTLMDGFLIIKSSIVDLPKSLFLVGDSYQVFLKHCFLGKPSVEFFSVITLIIIASFVPKVFQKNSLDEAPADEVLWFRELSSISRGVVYGVLLYLIIFCGASAQSFIYMQF